MTVYENSSEDEDPAAVDAFSTVSGSSAGLRYEWPEGASRYGELGGMTGDDLIRLAERELRDEA